MVVGGVGAVLNLELAQNAGLEVDEKNGVNVDEYLQTSDPNVFVAGDIAFFKDIALNKVVACRASSQRASGRGKLCRREHGGRKAAV